MTEQQRQTYETGVTGAMLTNRVLPRLLARLRMTLRHWFVKPVSRRVWISYPRQYARRAGR